jgi:hypothetical protein
MRVLFIRQLYRYMHKYTHSDKILLAKKIEKITEKNHINEVKKIIFNYNPKLQVVKKSTCILMYFHNLNDDTYNAIDKYIKTLFPEPKDVDNSSSEMCMSTQSSVKKREPRVNHKYSTKEKNLIRRQKYETQLNIINGTEKETINYEDYDTSSMRKNRTKNVQEKSSELDTNEDIHIFIKKM